MYFNVFPISKLSKRTIIKVNFFVHLYFTRLPDQYVKDTHPNIQDDFSIAKKVKHLTNNLMNRNADQYLNVCENYTFYKKI